MKLSFADERVLAVMAHPDDAELLCAGTLARARAEGAAVGVCVMCSGDKGMRTAATVNEAGAVRRSEAAEAAGLLGADLLWNGAPDGELADTPPQRRSVVEFYRQFKPTLVLTHAAEDYHPDHRAASLIAEAATWFCASRGHVTDSPALATPPALWWCDTLDMNGFVPTIYINISAFLETKTRMLHCHRSQLQRGTDGDFAPLAELMLRQCQVRGAQAGIAAAEAFRPHQAFKRTRAW